jgi:hypothetical protein
MNDVEQQLREALSEIPAPTVPVHDPLVAVDRRVRRARRRIAVAAAAGVAAVVAAVVVPLATTTSNGHDGLQVGKSPTPAPSVSNPPGVTTLSAPGPVLSVSANAAGAVYALGSWQVSDGAAFVGVVKGRQVTDPVTVQGPAHQVIADGATAWVIGTDSKGRSRLSVVSHLITTTDGALPGRIISATAANSSLYLLTASQQGLEVDRFIANKSGLGLTDFHPIPYAKRLVTDFAGQAWVQTDKELIPLQPQAQSFSLGTPVSWKGPVYGPASPSGVWAYDGRLIQLTPALLATGTSVAEGWRLDTTDVPSAALSAPDGTYYAVTSAADNSGNGVFYYSKRSMSDGAAKPDAALTGSGVTSLAPAPGGGVLVVRGGGTLQQWRPAGTR